MDGLDTSQGTEIVESLRELGLIGRTENPAMTPLTGGVSSDIWKIDAARGPFCVKRALAKLKVAADWRAPVSRNASEVGWMETARAIVPDSAPEILGHDPRAGLFAMAWLDPGRYRLWKTMLRDGDADPQVAAAVGRSIGRIHAATANDPAVAARFDTDEIFMAIRLEPYLLATGRAHPRLADRFGALAERTAGTRRALVHGDVSPKNILIGPDGPVFLDAECAWYGDPAFDIAFCMNHLLLKCLWAPAATEPLLACFAALGAAWLAQVDWEPAHHAEERAATLLPALTLARVDGKSPVEYLIEPGDKEFVRRTARDLIMTEDTEFDAIGERWRSALNRHHG